MGKTFQDVVDSALRGVPCHTIHGPMHFEPIHEITHRAKLISLLSEPQRLQPSNGTSRVHIGAGGGFNFSIAAKTRPDKILLLDANIAQNRLWHAVIDLLAQCDSPDAFYERFKTVMSQSPAILRKSNPYVGTYPLHADWMTDPGAYAYLHHMAQDGNIATAMLDVINDSQAMHAIGDAIKNHHMEVDTCYWSNIMHFIQPYAAGSSPDEPKTLSTESDVLNTKDGGLVYGQEDFYQYLATVDTGEPSLGSTKLFEDMLHNMSAIGNDAHTNHIFMTTSLDPAKLIVTDGPPRDPKARRANFLERYLQEQGRGPDYGMEM